MIPPERVRVALVRRPLGLAGELLVEPLTDNEARFRAGTELLAGDIRLRLARARRQPGGLVLKLEGVDDMDAAAALRGTYLEVPAAEAEPLPEGSHYHWQLIGLSVVDMDGTALGRLEAVDSYPANDVFVVMGERGELLVPALAAVVKEIDIERGLMVVDMPPELEVK